MRPSCPPLLALVACLLAGCDHAPAPTAGAEATTYVERSLVSTTVSSPVDFSIAQAPSRIESTDCEDADVSVTRRTKDVTMIESPLFGTIKNGHVRIVVPKPGDYTLRYMGTAPCYFHVYEPASRKP